MNQNITDFQDFHLSPVEKTVLIAINLTLSAIGTFGNFLIIFAGLTTPHLRRKASNLILLSLAGADLMATMIIQPLFVFMLMFLRRCSFIRVMTIVYNILALVSLLSSLFHLASISIERAICTVKPLKHRFIIKRWYKRILGVCWGAAALSSCTLFISRHFKLAKLIVVVKVTVPILSLSIILGAYGIILYKIKFNRIAPTTSFAISAFAHRNRAMENRLSATIGIVILLFFACWISIVINFLLQSENSVNWCGVVLDKNFEWFHTINLSNSCMNFLVYSLRIRHFRTACRRIIMTKLRKLRQAVACCFCNQSDQNFNN